MHKKIFLFSPMQVDDDIGLDQFQANYLGMEEMKNYAMIGSSIRHALLKRA